MTPIRILHLEDDPIDAELIAMQLSSEHLDSKIVLVKSEAEFSEALTKGEFDVILADNAGPRFSGRDALAIARDKQPTVPFLFVTGSAEGESAVAAMKSGSDGYVLKHRLAELVPAIQRALETKNK